jgi:hypothetical protein
VPKAFKIIKGSLGFRLSFLKTLVEWVRKMKTISRKFKRIASVFALTTFLSFGSSFSVFAETDDGSLHLNTDILTNERTGAAGGNEVTSQLFSSDIEARVKEQTADELKTLSVKPDLTFVVKKDNSQKEQAELKSNLFKSYSPNEALGVSESMLNRQTGEFILVIVGGLILAVLAGFLGQKFGRRRSRVRYK